MSKKWFLGICIGVLLAASSLVLSLQLLPQNTVETELVAVIPKRIQKAPAYNPQTPSLDTIFSNDHSWIATVSAEHIRVLLATGDVIPARSVNVQTVGEKGFIWPFAKTVDILKNADITFANLETPLLSSCIATTEGMAFCGSPGNVAGLTFAGIDIVSLANNHAYNYGKEGIMETKRLLEQNSIAVTGVDGPLVQNVRGIMFAFLGYNDITTPQPGVANTDEERIQREIASAKKLADIVIVTYHWGVEYQAQPDERQKYLGHFTIDAGADLVIGNHPHWIQPIEFYKGKLITYAHGNFVFDQMWSEETKKGVIGRYIFYDKELIDVEYLPVYIENFGQPSFLEGEEKRVILDHMKDESIKLISQ